MSDDSKQPLIVWWVIWAALQTGVFVIYFFLGGPATQPQPSSPVSSIWLVGLAPFVLSTIIRWLVLPQIQNARTALPWFIVGMALAEATCILGIFVFPAQREVLFILGALGIFQFIPYFARRYFD
jgi:hypothetical protein